jgi:hypothetical protein
MRSADAQALEVLLLVCCDRPVIYAVRYTPGIRVHGLTYHISIVLLGLDAEPLDFKGRQ